MFAQYDRVLLNYWEGFLCWVKPYRVSNLAIGKKLTAVVMLALFSVFGMLRGRFVRGLPS